MKILIIENDVESLNNFKATLQQDDYDVLTASKGREALETLKNIDKIDLIISNLVLKDLDGIELLKYLKNNRKFSAIPLLFVSDKADQNTIMKAVQLGVAGFLVKPVAPNTLLEKVKNIFDNLPGSIMVVDDEEVIRTLLQKVIENDGYRVLTAESGEDALELLKRHKVAAVISDIKMPGMSGVELLQEIKDLYPFIPVMLMTGFKLDFNRINAISVGADNFISKPFKNTEILQKLSLAISASKKLQKT